MQPAEIRQRAFAHPAVEQVRAQLVEFKRDDRGGAATMAAEIMCHAVHRTIPA
jgi:hypothetical protein